MLAVWGSYTCRFKYSFTLQIVFMFVENWTRLSLTPFLKVFMLIPKVTNDPGAALKVECVFLIFLLNGLWCRKWKRSCWVSGYIPGLEMTSCPQHGDKTLETNITCSWSLFLSCQQWKRSGLYTDLTLKIIIVIVFHIHKYWQFLKPCNVTQYVIGCFSVDQLELIKPFQNDFITS